jgi:hypothetical protein
LSSISLNLDTIVVTAAGGCAKAYQRIANAVTPIEIGVPGIAIGSQTRHNQEDTSSSSSTKQLL